MNRTVTFKMEKKRKENKCSSSSEKYDQVKEMRTKELKEMK